MTDYNPISETETDPGAPGTSSLWKRWSKNWLAGFEGAPGAPRLMVGAHYAPAAGDVRLIDFISGQNEEVASSTTTTVSRSIPQSYFTALNACTLRVVLAFQRTGNIGGAVSIIKNGTAVQSWAAGGSFSADVPMNAGDTLRISISAIGSGGGAEGRNILSAGEYRVDKRSVARA